MSKNSPEQQDHNSGPNPGDPDDPVFIAAMHASIERNRGLLRRLAREWEQEPDPARDATIARQLVDCERAVDRLAA